MNERFEDSHQPDFKVGPWWVRPQLNALERDDQNGDQSVNVEARSMAVLVSLAAHAPAVVSKDRLIREAWSDSPHVSDEVVSHAIWELRKVFGDNAKAPSYIETIARKGYRLLADVLHVSGSPLPLEGVRIDHYQLEKEIGRGSMGVVFRAVDTRLGRTVAIKFLAADLTRDPASRRRFQREARLAASMDHPNLCPVHEIGETSRGHQYIVSPFCSGGSLKDRLGRGAIAVDEAMAIARQLVAGLGAAHERGIVHRDIKPANLLFDEHGTLKIGDFGIAKLQGVGTDLTRTGASLGTPAYKSPEQATGHKIDHRTDLWSAGVVMFEMLTGRRPFDADYELAVVHSILSVRAEPITNAAGEPLPEEVRRVVAKAMAKDPEERYQDASEMQADLETPGEAVPPLGALGIVGSPRIARLLITAFVVAIGVWLVSTLRNWDFDSGELADVSQLIEQAHSLWLRGDDSLNIKKARGLFEQALKLDETSVDARSHLAYFMIMRIGSEDRREDVKDRVAVLLAGLEKTWMVLTIEAEVANFEDHPKIAELRARLALSMKPGCKADEHCDIAFLALGGALYLQGQFEEAKQTLRDCTKQGHGNIRCRLELARMLANDMGDREQAILVFKEVLTLDSEQTSALDGLATVYSQLGRNDEAIPVLSELWRLIPDYKNAYSFGNGLYEDKQFLKAADYYRRALSLAEAEGRSTSKSLVALGDVSKELGNDDEAHRFYLKALSAFDENHSQSLLKHDFGQRAVCLAKIGRLEEAWAIMEDLFQGRSETDGLLFVYGARIAALADNRALLFRYARIARELGQPSYRLTDDVAFRDFDRDPDYKAVLSLVDVEAP